MENGKEGAFACPDNGTEYTTTWQGQVGLTKREYFAGLAMQGILASNIEGLACGRIDIPGVIQSAVKASDALLIELEKTK